MLNKKMKSSSQESSNNMDGMLKIIACLFCGRNYDKNNKPYILKCSHNICYRCLRLNVSNLVCIKCKFNCSQRDLSKFPLNFLLAEIVDKLENNSANEPKKGSKKKKIEKELTINESELFFCNQCNLVITNYEFHQTSFQGHEMIDYKKYINSKTEGYILKEKILMDKFKETKEKYIQTHKDYFSLVINNIFLRLDELLKGVESSDLLDNLEVLGIISDKEKANFTQFCAKYPKEFLMTVLKESKIDNIYNMEIKVKNTSNEMVLLEGEEERKSYIDAFFVDLNSIEHTMKKLTNLEHNLEDVEKKVLNLDMKEVTKNVFEDIIIQTNHSLNISLKKQDFISFSYYLTEKFNLFLFNPITLELDTYNLSKIKDFENIFLKGSSIILDDQKNLYVSGGINAKNDISSDIYRINLSTCEVNKLLPMIEGRCYHHSFIRDNKFYAIMGKTFNKDTNTLENVLTCEKFDIFLNEWKKLPNFPKNVKELKSFFCDQNYNFGIDNLKRIFYLTEKNKWKECSINFKDSIETDLKNFIIIPHDDNLYFIGGVNPQNELSDKILRFSTDVEEFSQMKNSFCKKIQFEANSYSNFNHNYYVLEITLEEKEKYVVNVYKTSNIKECQFSLEKTFTFLDKI